MACWPTRRFYRAIGLTGDAGTFSATTTILWKGNPSENGITEAYVKNNIISTINVRFSEKMANYLMSQPQSTPASGQTEAATAPTKSTDHNQKLSGQSSQKGLPAQRSGRLHLHPQLG